jgi:hypothetical protein
MMTAQCPDQLINHYPPVDFAELSLYRIYNGDIAGDLSNETYPLQNSSDKTKHGRFSACWKGFTRTYELAADGRLSLTGFEYPFTDNKGDTTSELLAGDFWLELRDEFFGPRTHVPFVDGIIIHDKAQWVVEDHTPRPAPPVGFLRRCNPLYWLGRIIKW